MATDANRVLADLTSPGMFATFAAVRLDMGGSVEIALAGHLPILWFRAGTNLVERLPNGSLPLGVDSGEALASDRVTAAPGDIFAIFPDGLTEVRDGNGLEAGLEGVDRIIGGSVGQGGTLRAIHERVMESIAAHGERSDDQSLVLIRVVTSKSSL